MITYATTSVPAAGRPRGSIRMLVTLSVVVAMLAPMGYVIGRYWQTAEEAGAFVATERAGVAYVDSITKLLARLGAAQSAAVRGSRIDAAAVRKAAGEVTRIDRESGDPLGVRRRWEQLPPAIESALSQKATGEGALRAYAVPVGLLDGLLREIGDASKIVRDPELDAYYLMDAALLRIPEVIVQAGQLDALAHQASKPPAASQADVERRIGVALDRVAGSAKAISAGLRTGTDATSADAGRVLLKPLDEFVAAVDALVAAAPAPGTARKPSAALSLAHERVRESALVLDAAVLNQFDSLLEARADGLSGQRLTALVAAVLGVLAAALLVWVRMPGRAIRHVPVADAPGAKDNTDGRGSASQSPDSAGGPAPHLVDARELSNPVPVHVGRVAAPAKHRR